MKIQYDSEADAIYIEFGPERPALGVDVPNISGVSVDVDNEGKLLGIEIIGVSHHMDLQVLSELSFEDLVSGQSGKIVLSALASREKTSARKVS